MFKKSMITLFLGLTLSNITYAGGGLKIPNPTEPAFPGNNIGKDVTSLVAKALEDTVDLYHVSQVNRASCNLVSDKLAQRKKEFAVPEIARLLGRDVDPNSLTSPLFGNRIVLMGVSERQYDHVMGDGAARAINTFLEDAYPEQRVYGENGVIFYNLKNQFTTYSAALTERLQDLWPAAYGKPFPGIIISGNYNPGEGDESFVSNGTHVFTGFWDMEPNLGREKLNEIERLARTSRYNYFIH